MMRLKRFLFEKKMIIIIIFILLICSISIAVGMYVQNTKQKPEENKENEINYTELEESFQYIFTNDINKSATANINVDYDNLIFCAYDIPPEESGNYKINAKIPLFKLENEATKKINEEIWNTFITKMVSIAKEATVYTTYSIDYVVYVNNNILSLVIRCKYKNGANPQRDIIQTYNYDIENEKILTLREVLEYKGLDKNEVQKKIHEKIAEENKKIESVSAQGYNVYLRAENDIIYEIDNTPNFFLGKDNYLYLVYSYGNKNYTDVIDLVIF